MFEPPPETKWNVLNLGAGVQSSCLALMAAKGEIGPMPDFAVFADTQAEPESVYRWLDWLKEQLPFPVYTVTNGNLTDSELLPRVSKRSGKKYLKNSIPVFGRAPNGEIKAALGRKCTADFKIAPIIKEIKSRCGVVRAQKEITVTQWIGISWDELQRMKHPAVKWTQHRWPLIEKHISRQQCIEWMKQNGFPEPPRSACVYCPFHDNTEWRRLRNDEPEEFQKAIEFDYKLRQAHRDHNETMDMDVFLHRSCKPLDQIDFDNDEDKGQMTWDFQAECDGMCGL